MVYAGKIGDKKYSLGVSGRLKDSNLIMWDEETNSLWSQIKGEALYGESKGEKLGMLPAIFVGLGTWKRMHVDTLVLDLSNVRATSWFYKTDDLAKGAVHMRTRRGQQRKAVLGIGLRHKGETLCVAMPMLHDNGLVQEEVGGVPLLVVWDKTESAALVYDRRYQGKTLAPKLQGSKLVTKDGKHGFDVLTGRPAKGQGEPLTRFPYLPTYLRSWQTYYPKGRVLQ
jgi:hypothetical protein